MSTQQDEGDSLPYTPKASPYTESSSNPASGSLPGQTSVTSSLYDGSTNNDSPAPALYNSQTTSSPTPSIQSLPDPFLATVAESSVDAVTSDNDLFSNHEAPAPSLYNLQTTPSPAPSIQSSPNPSLAPVAESTLDKVSPENDDSHSPTHSNPLGAGSTQAPESPPRLINSLPHQSLIEDDHPPADVVSSENEESCSPAQQDQITEGSIQIAMPLPPSVNSSPNSSLIDVAEYPIGVVSRESSPHTPCTENPHIDLTLQASTSGSIPEKEIPSPPIHPDIEQPCESSSLPANHPLATKSRFGDITSWPDVSELRKADIKAYLDEYNVIFNQRSSFALLRATYNSLRSHFTAIGNVEQPSKHPRTVKPIDSANQQLPSARRLRKRNHARAQSTSAATDVGFVYTIPAQGNLETTDPFQSHPTSPTSSLPALSNYEPSIAPTSATSMSFESISTQSTRNRLRKRPAPTSNESRKRQKKSNVDQVPSETRTFRKRGRRAIQVAQPKSPRKRGRRPKSFNVEGADAAGSSLGGQPASADSATAAPEVQSNRKNKWTALSPVTKRVKRA